MEDDYQVTFRVAALLGTWTWSAVAPDGRRLGPLGFGFASKEAAESNALRRIEQDRATESISGRELARRVDLREGRLTIVKPSPLRADEGRAMLERLRDDFEREAWNLYRRGQDGSDWQEAHRRVETLLRELADKEGCPTAFPELRDPATAYYTQDND